MTENFAMILPLYRLIGGSMLAYRARFVVVWALATVCVPALAQSPSQNQKSAPVQQKPAATKQLQYANQGIAQRNHTFDGTRAPSNPVRANPAPKPSPVGQPVYSSPGHPGYKPAQSSLHVNPVPPPSVARSTTTVPSSFPTVARSTSTVTPTVTRSTTSATAPAKKP